MSYSVINKLSGKDWRDKGWRDSESKLHKAVFLIATMCNNYKDTLTAKCFFLNGFIFSSRYLIHSVIGSKAFSTVFEIKFYTNFKNKTMKGRDKDKIKSNLGEKKIKPI